METGPFHGQVVGEEVMETGPFYGQVVGEEVTKEVFGGHAKWNGTMRKF